MPIRDKIAADERARRVRCEAFTYTAVWNPLPAGAARIPVDRGRGRLSQLLLGLDLRTRGEEAPGQLVAQRPWGSSSWGGSATWRGIGRLIGGIAPVSLLVWRARAGTPVGCLRRRTQKGRRPAAPRVVLEWSGGLLALNAVSGWRRQRPVHIIS